MFHESGNDGDTEMGIGVGLRASSLKDALSDVRKACKDSALGPLLAAATVERLGREWGTYEAEAAAKTLSECLQAACGRGKHHGWFLMRHRAVEALGGLRATCHLHHEAAVWAFRRLPEAKRAEFMKAIAVAFIRNGRNPLTKPQAVRVAKAMDM